MGLCFAVSRAYENAQGFSSPGKLLLNPYQIRKNNIHVTIETIGYGGKKPDDFFRELESLNPDIVVDFRENPHRAYLGVYTLSHLTKRLGSKYVWVKELGNKTRQMPPTLVDEGAGLKKLQELAKTHQRIVLLCAEKLEENCHRGYVKKRFLELTSED